MTREDKNIDAALTVLLLPFDPLNPLIGRTKSDGDLNSTHSTSNFSSENSTQTPTQTPTKTPGGERPVTVVHNIDARKQYASSAPPQQDHAKIFSISHDNHWSRLHDHLQCLALSPNNQTSSSLRQTGTVPTAPLPIDFSEENDLASPEENDLASVEPKKKITLAEIVAQTVSQRPLDNSVAVPIQPAASEKILNATQLKINSWQILLNAPFVLWALCVALIFSGLSDKRANHKIGWEISFDSSAFILNFPLAILIGQKVSTTFQDSLLRLRDPAYLSLIAFGLFLAVAATIPSLPLADDAAKELFPHAHRTILYSADGINGLNTFLTRFLGAIAILLLVCSKFFISRAQPDHDLLEQPAYSTVIAKRVGYALSATVALGTGPLWYDLTERGANRIVKGVPHAVLGLLALPSVGFYARFLFLLPTTLLKTFQTLQKEFTNKSSHFALTATWVALFFISMLALLSGTGLGSEGQIYGDKNFKSYSSAVLYGILCMIAAGGVNENGALNLLLDIFTLRDRFKDFNLSFWQAVLQKFFNCYEAIALDGSYKKLEAVYSEKNINTSSHVRQSVSRSSNFIEEVGKCFFNVSKSLSLLFKSRSTVTTSTDLLKEPLLLNESDSLSNNSKAF